MKYLHYIITEEEVTIESSYSNSNQPKLSLQSLAKIKKAKYFILDRETNNQKEIKL